MILELALASAFMAPPVCTPHTVTTRSGVAVMLNTDCTEAGTVTITTPPVSGTLPALPGLYTPAPGFHGVDHLFYTVTSAGGETSLPTAINLVVDDGPPSCTDGTATTPVNTPLKLAFPCTDPDGDPVIISAEDGAHGVVDPDSGPELTYTPERDFVGTDEISFTGKAGGFETATHKLTITVTAAVTPTATPVPTATPAPPAPAATPGPVADKTAPKLTVKAGKASIAKGVALTLTSDEAGTAKLTLTTGKNTSTASAKLVKGTAKVTLKLSANARKALKAKKRAKATLTVVATDAASNRATKKLSVTLKR
jgi:hypothetical protein